MYSLDFTVNGATQKQTFEIKKDPRLSLDQEDYNAQMTFIKDINSKVTESHQAIIEMREIKDQLKKYKEILSENAALVGEIDHIHSTLTVIEDNLYQTKNRSNQDPLNFPIRLTNKLSHLNSLIQVGDYPPTDQSYEVKDVLIGQINEELAKYETIKNDVIPGLNQKIRENKIDYILIKDKKE